MMRGLLISAALLLLECGGSAVLEEHTGAGGNEGSAGGAASVSGGAGSRSTCEGELSVLGSFCLPTFDRLFDPALNAQCDGYSASPCDDLLSYDTGPFGSGTCAYDPMTHALVGARITTDTSSYCDGTSSDKSAGRVPSYACGAQLVPCAGGDVDAGGP